jgi:hypothetical protein
VERDEPVQRDWLGVALWRAATSRVHDGPTLLQAAAMELGRNRR